MIVLDTHAWIEYLWGSESGYQIRKLVEKEKCCTLETNLAEVYSWALRENESFLHLMKIIKENSEIVPVTLKDWLRATEIRDKIRKERKGFGIIDALLLVFQENNNCKIITGDPHFKGLKNVVFLS